MANEPESELFDEENGKEFDEEVEDERCVCKAI